MNEQMEEDQTPSKESILTKIVFVGDTQVGKTNLIKHLAGKSIDDSYQTTIGVDFSLESVELEDAIVKLQLWDTAGQERFKALNTGGLYRNIGAYVIVFDRTQPFNTTDLENRINDVKKNMKVEEGEPNPEFYFVINKTDQPAHSEFFPDSTSIPDELFNAVSDLVGCDENEVKTWKAEHIFECSTVTPEDQGIKDLKDQIAKDMYARYQAAKEATEKTEEAPAPQKPLTFREKLEEYTAWYHWLGAALKAFFSGFQFTLSWRKLGLAKRLKDQWDEADKIAEDGGEEVNRQTLIADFEKEHLKMVDEEYQHAWFFKENYREAELKEPGSINFKLGELGDILKQEGKALREVDPKIKENEVIKKVFEEMENILKTNDIEIDVTETQCRNALESVRNRLGEKRIDLNKVMVVKLEYDVNAKNAKNKVQLSFSKKKECTQKEYLNAVDVCQARLGNKPRRYDDYSISVIEATKQNNEGKILSNVDTNSFFKSSQQSSLSFKLGRIELEDSSDEEVISNTRKKLIQFLKDNSVKDCIISLCRNPGAAFSFSMKNDDNAQTKHKKCEKLFRQTLGNDIDLNSGIQVIRLVNFFKKQELSEQLSNKS